MELPDLIRKRIQIAAEAKGWSMRQAAIEAGISPATLSSFMRSDTHMLREKSIKALSDALEIDLQSPPDLTIRDVQSLEDQLVEFVQALQQAKTRSKARALVKKYRDGDDYVVRSLDLLASKSTQLSTLIHRATQDDDLGAAMAMVQLIERANSVPDLQLQSMTFRTVLFGQKATISITCDEGTLPIREVLDGLHRMDPGIIISQKDHPEG